MSSLENKEIFSRNLNKYINKSGKTRTEICKDLGLKYTTFTDWVNGNKYPRIDKIEMLANYFGIKKSELIEEQLLRCDYLYDQNDTYFVSEKLNDYQTSRDKQFERIEKYYNLLDARKKKMALEYIEHLNELQNSENELRAAHNNYSDDDDEINKINSDFDKF